MPSLSAPYFAVHDPLAYTMPSHSLLSSQYLTGVPFSTSGSGRRKYSQHANDRNKGQSEHYGQKDENTNHNTQSRWQKRAAESNTSIPKKDPVEEPSEFFKALYDVRYWLFISPLGSLALMLYLRYPKSQTQEDVEKTLRCSSCEKQMVDDWSNPIPRRFYNWCKYGYPKRLTCLDCSKSKVVQVFVGKGPNGSDSYGPASFISYKVATPTLYGQVPLAPKLPSEWDIAPQHQPQLQ